MVTLKDIFKAVCGHFSEVTQLDIIDSDVEEPIVRPSLKIFMDTVNTGTFNTALREVRVYFNVYFYASDKGHSKAEIYEIEDKIALSFLEPFEIKENCAVYIDDVKFEKVTDGILNCSFDFEIGVEYVDESDIEPMEELSINEETEV